MSNEAKIGDVLYYHEDDMCCKVEVLDRRVDEANMLHMRYRILEPVQQSKVFVPVEAGEEFDSSVTLDPVGSAYRYTMWTLRPEPWSHVLIA